MTRSISAISHFSFAGMQCGEGSGVSSQSLFELWSATTYPSKPQLLYILHTCTTAVHSATCIAVQWNLTTLDEEILLWKSFWQLPLMMKIKISEMFFLTNKWSEFIMSSGRSDENKSRRKMKQWNILAAKNSLFTVFPNFEMWILWSSRWLLGYRLQSHNCHCNAWNADALLFR